MKNWLAKFAEETKSEEDILHDTVANLPKSMLEELRADFDPSLRYTQMDEMEQKIADAQNMGRALASDTAEKTAMLGAIAEALPGLVAGGAKMLAGGGVKSAIGAGVGALAKNKATSTAGRAFSSLNNARGGGFNYGKVAFAMPAAVSNMAQKATGYLVKNPGTAATAVGAAGGALLAPRDQQTGQKQYLRGAVAGGLIGAGANAATGGAVGNKMRSAVMNRQSPLLGQKARSYAMDAAASGSKMKGPLRPAPAASPRQDWHRAGRQGPAPDPGYAGGPTMGTPKVAFVKRANQQKLIYDPATKTFTRHHLTADTTMGHEPGNVIPAGHSEPAGRAMPEPKRGSAPAGLAPSAGSSMTHELHGGSVLSSSPGRGLAARAAGSPPPVPAAAMRGAARAPMGGVIGAGASAMKSKLPSLSGAVSLAGGLKKIAQARR